jgi:2',3'-cyclic-nucleotide 2'-phosphodiesterase / 3'-nucleotidase
MATTDLHMHVLPYDYCTDRPTDRPALAHIKQLVDSLRAEVPHSLLVDAGDFLQGTPMADYFGLEVGLGADETHPIIAAMNALDYDAATLGNHEFDFGLDFLERVIAAARFPVVSANLVRADGVAADSGDSTLLPPYAILERSLETVSNGSHPIRIGVIGLAPPQVVTWERTHLAGRVEAHDIIETAAARVPQLRAAGADLVIALAHTGIGSDRHVAGMENAALPLARVPGIDLLVLGHSHLVFPHDDFSDRPAVDLAAGTLHGRPAVMPGRWGSHLGVIDLVLARTGRGWQLRHARVQARRVSTAATPRASDRADPCPISRIVAAPHKAVRTHLGQKIGQTTRPLHSYFAQIADGPALRLVAAAQRAWVQERLRETLLDGVPVLSAVAPFRVGGRGGPDNYTDIPAGHLLQRHLHDLYTFPNSLAVLRLTGAALRGWLERVAGLYAVVSPGMEDVPLILPDAAGYNFDLIDGLAYSFDLSQPPLFDALGAPLRSGPGRVRDLFHAGRPVRDNDRFLLVTNNFRVGGGGNFPGVSPAMLVLETPTPVRQILREHVAALGRVPALTESRTDGWRLRLPVGSSALFDTGPGAETHLYDIDHLGAEFLGLRDNGFVRLRLRA